MRLIDADHLLFLLNSAIELRKKLRRNTSDLDIMVDAVNDEPTAYDPDKVVEQLEERTEFLKDCAKYGNKTKDQQSKSYDTMMMYEVKDLVDDLLEIVKAGVADAKTDS
ncbi:MAG TPA: hypothetical protein DC035_02785 [Lachnospiraceae bacterium]|nr:hypothetical protein [Lachnospiraceae bacterium]